MKRRAHRPCDKALEEVLATGILKGFCPHLRVNLIDTVLSNLPDRVEVTDKGPWKYSRSHEEVPGSIKIIDVEKRGEFEFKDEYYADGVRPQGLIYLEELLQKAFAKANISDITASDLVR